MRALFDSCLNRLSVAQMWPMSLGEGSGRAGRRLVSMIHAGPCMVQAGDVVQAACDSGLDQAPQGDLVRDECDIHRTTQVPG